MAFSPSALTRLQRAILEGIRSSEDFYLSGGAALSAYYLAHRQSLDLDLFTTSQDSVEALEVGLAELCRARVWELGTVQRYPGFRRFIVSDGAESTLVDTVYEPVEQVVPIDEKPIEDGLRYDALEDLIANKLCAALGRGDIKDLVDLYFLDQADADPLRYLEAARRKDGGMEPLTLAWALHATPADPSRLLLLRPVSPADLLRYRDELVGRLATIGWPTEEGAGKANG